MKAFLCTFAILLICAAGVTLFLSYVCFDGRQYAGVGAWVKVVHAESDKGVPPGVAWTQAAKAKGVPPGEVWNQMEQAVDLETLKIWYEFQASGYKWLACSAALGFGGIAVGLLAWGLGLRRRLREPH